jgi:zinc protease
MTPSAATLLALTLAAPAAAPRGGVLPFRTVERTLRNGLRVIVAPTGVPGPVSLHVAVQVGSRNEFEPGKTGYAHLVEHLMFRGTRAWPAARYQAELSRLGAQQNADTGDDLTDYHVTFAREDLDRILTLEADRFMNLEVPVDAFKTETRSILGEYDKDASSPPVRLDEAQRAAAFKVHPYGHPTLGRLADVEDMANQHEHARLFQARWYRPERTTVIVAGDVAPERVLALVEQRFGRWARGGAVPAIPREPPPAGPARAHVEWPSPTQPWLSVAFRAPAFSDTGAEWAAAHLLFALEAGETSALHRHLVDEEQLVDALSVDAGPSVDEGIFTVTARVRRVEDLLRVRDEILAAFARARRVAPDARRLADVVAAERNALLRTLDSSDAVAATLAQYSAFDRTAATLDRLHRTYASLRPDDVLAAARAVATDAGLVVTILAHGALPPGADATPPLATLDPAAAGGEGDVQLVALPSPLPVITLQLAFDAGSARDPEGKEGLAAVAAAMLADAGSRRMGIDEIRAALHPLAATFTAQVDKEQVTLSGTFPREGWERFLDVALAQLTDPGFRDEDFRRVKEDQLAALVQDLRDGNDEELARERLQASLFAGTPYGHPAAGTVAGLQAVTLDDVKAFVRARYVRATLSAAVGGDAPPALLARVRRVLAALPAGERTPAQRPAARRPKGLEVEVIEKEARGTTIVLGHPLDVVRGDPDFVALWLARSWLGEHRSASSHLYQRLREARGLGYGAYAYVEAFPHAMDFTAPVPGVPRRAQLFEIWIRPVAPRQAQMALRIAVHELRRLVAEGLTQEQFEATRAYLLKSTVALEASQADRVGQALDARWYGVAPFPAYLRDGLARLTRDEVNAAIRRHLSGDDLAVVAVTRDAQGLAAALLADGPSAVAYEASQPPELLDEDRRIGALRLGLAPKSVRVVKAGDVFAR